MASKVKTFEFLMLFLPQFQIWKNGGKFEQSTVVQKYIQYVMSNMESNKESTVAEHSS